MTTRARKTMGTGALLALAVLFIAIILVSTFLLRGARLDLTQNRLYTIAPGTERILGSLEEPVNLYFFFSDTASQSVPPVRAYAQRVRGNRRLGRGKVLPVCLATPFLSLTPAGSLHFTRT